ncbi:MULTISPECIES: hypothetical protein [Deinococcus]|uniref:Uncharacterized protein n=1 Tax=Deinococcus aluminii TaxID=1656885 RepID=A0ABP9XJM8_9DEIO|nr:hypothetical protein [Deinococcus sp. DB0503]MBI0446874.1 hypothetical protein [Deinococcus sp. DB0503]
MNKQELIQWLRTAPQDPKDAGAKILESERPQEHLTLAQAVANLKHVGPALHTPHPDEAELLP